MKRLNLGWRVTLASGLSTAAVMAGFAWILHHSLQRAIGEWETANLAAIGHHAAGMIAGFTSEKRQPAAAELSEELQGFDVELALVGQKLGNEMSGAGPSVSVPLSTGDGAVVVTSTRPAAQSLGRRLAPLYLGLSASLLVVLFLVIEGSIFWGFVRPLRAVRQQLRMMRRGPWRWPAKDDGVAEVVALAHQVEEVGETLEQRVTQWVEAERRAGGELTREALRRAALPLAREINLMTSDLLAKDDLSPDAVRALRRLQAAGLHLTALYTLPLDEIIDVKLAPQEPTPSPEEAP